MTETLPQRTIDPDKLMSFVFRAVDEVGATLNTATVVMGDKLGYYTVMAAYTGEAPVFPSCGSSSEPKGYITNWTVTNNTFELATAYIDDCPARRQGTFVWSGNTGG